MDVDRQARGRSGRGKSNNPWAERTPETADQAAQIIELRRRRLVWSDIAEQMGMSIANVRKLYNRALSEIPAQHVDEHRAEELILIDDAVADLMNIARDDKVSHRSRIEAWSVIRTWAERKAKLLGLDAPTQSVSIDKIDAEIMALTREVASLAELDEAGAPVEP